MSRRSIPRNLRTVAVLCTAALMTGCGVSLEQLPLPAPTAGGRTYNLTAIFTDALNLPAKAKVKLNGADIGEVDSVAAQDFTAHVTMRIRADVWVHEGDTAELRSATPLGDVFVQLRPTPASTAGSPPLHDGDTIGLKSTAAAPTIEELLDSMALLVNGGAIRYLVSVVNGAGQAMGGRGDKVHALLQQSTELLTRMTARSTQLDGALRATSELAAAISARHASLDASLAAAAPALTALSDNTSRVIELTQHLAALSTQLERFPSLKGTDTRSTIGDLNHLAAAVNDIAADPDLSLTALNRLIGIGMHATNSTALHGIGNLAKLTSGVWPGKNYPGDPDMHWPDGTDWHLMVGSLRYEWNLLLDNIYGAQRWNPAAPR